MDNLDEVLHQIRDFGITLRSRPDDMERIRTFTPGKKTTIGKGGKSWFKFFLWRPDVGGQYITGSFGTYSKGGDWQKVEHDWAPLSQAEKERRQRERDAAAAIAAKEREEAARVAAFNAGELWHHASREGRSPYLERKGLKGEACRYLPDGTLVILMIRYDLPRECAIRGAQRLLPDGQKFYSKDLDKIGAALRLGAVDEATRLILVCEGYATGLTIRTALEWSLPVFVSFDAGNLEHVVPLLRRLYPQIRILICADDDFLTRDPTTKKLNNPGRTTARRIMRRVEACEVTYPIFKPETRVKGDTDFDDLRIREGIEVCARQLRHTIKQMEAVRG